MPTQIKEKPIIFSTEMVRAILDGHKSQTRRVVKPQPHKYQTFVKEHDDYWSFGSSECDQSAHCVRCPYGQVGSKLWVRETWTTETCYNGFSPSEIPNAAKIFYLANGFNSFGMDKEEECFHNIRPSIFMPRWASRITLEITEIRVERLNQITEDDVTKEGIDNLVTFMLLWDGLNKKRGYEWESNCWVWVITFKLCQ